MKKLVIIITLAVIISGCVEERNRKNLNQLEVGITRVQVLEIMGEPYRREAQGNNEWLLYPTELKSSRGVMGFPDLAESEWLTPLLLKEGKLKGWGQNYWTTKEQKFDVKIDQAVTRPQ